MVRIKHRYLLINVLYPDQKSARPAKPLVPTTTTGSRAGDSEIPWTVQFRRPSSDQFTAKVLLKLIRDGVSEMFGDYGSGMIAASLQIKYISSATSTAIIRVSRANYRIVWAALSFATKLPHPVDELCVIQVVKVSGTMKKVEEEAVRQARKVILRAQREGLSSSSTALLSNDASPKRASTISRILDDQMDLDASDNLRDSPDESEDDYDED